MTKESPQQETQQKEPMAYIARVIASSINELNATVSTIEVTFPRFILPQVSKHGLFSISTSSMRAMPVRKVVEASTFTPLTWRRDEKGMSPSGIVDNEAAIEAEELWKNAMDSAGYYATRLADLGIAKETANRLVEPFAWCTCVITSSYWANFLELRLAPDSQVEIRDLAAVIVCAMARVVPRKVSRTGMHLPYINNNDRAELDRDSLAMVSAARCARVSYGRVLEDRAHEADIELFHRLAHGKHWSPLEHVLLPVRSRKVRGRQHPSWLSFRNVVEGASSRK